jgi:surface polysaccharide O-acyltransferase-like enzyme
MQVQLTPYQLQKEIKMVVLFSGFFQSYAPYCLFGRYLKDMKMEWMKKICVTSGAVHLLGRKW